MYKIYLYMNFFQEFSISMQIILLIRLADIAQEMTEIKKVIEK